MRQVRIAALASLALAFVAAAVPAAAQSWSPTHSLRIVSPYSAGGTNDLLSRLMAQKLGEALGQTVIVDNRTGANGIIGVESVAKSPADGYTLVMTSAATHAINPALYSKLPYDAVRDFTPVGLIATVPMLLVVNPSLPVSNVKELVALAKSKPGSFSAGSPGVGSSPHMASELFRLATGIDSVHVAYKGDAPALADLIGGQITLMFSNMPSALPFVHSGKLKALAMTGTRRADSEPGIPTMAEAGVPEVNNSTWYGLMAPGNLPPEILQRLGKELENVLKLPDVKQTIRQLGANPEAGGAEAFRKLVDTDLAKYAKVVKAAGIKQE
jgi:tripartite-type tricarboxylate transporter receptor subunit TctC